MMTKRFLPAFVLAALLGLCSRADAAPGLAWSSFLGGAGVDNAYGATACGNGDIIVAGSTNSANYPITAGAFQSTSGGGTDVVITRFGSDGTTVLWSTLLGGSGDDIARGVALGPDGSVYVTGYTTSRNFPVTSGAWRTQHAGGVQEGFLTRINPSGTALVYSTYVGGSWDDYPRGIGVDASGAATIAGFTNSVDFPVTSGVVKTTRNPGLYDGADGFVTKLNPAGSAVVYSTYLGTNTGTDEIMAIALDGSGRATVTGWTVAPGFPTTTGAYDRTLSDYHEAFVTRLNATGTGYVFSTFLGGAGQDEGYGIAVDASDATYVTGRTTSADFPTTAGAPQRTFGGGTCWDAFAAKLSADGSSLSYGTYLGGGGDDQGWAIAVSSGGQAAVVGSTASGNYPTSSGALGTSLAGGADAFLTCLDAAGTQLLYSTCLGSAGTDGASGAAFQPGGRAVLVGSTDNAGFPVTPQAFDRTQNSAGANDAFVSSFEVGATSGNVGVDDVPAVAGLTLKVGPNPFRAATTISLSIDRPGRVSVRIVDVQGRTVRELADQELQRGSHILSWDGRDERGIDPGVGVFFVEVTGPSYRRAQPVVHLR